MATNGAENNNNLIKSIDASEEASPKLTPAFDQRRNSTESALHPLIERVKSSEVIRVLEEKGEIIPSPRLSRNSNPNTPARSSSGTITASTAPRNNY